MNEHKIFTATLVVFLLLAPIVIAPLGETSVTISSSDTGGSTGATTSLKANGASCSAANECTGGFCNSGVCASSAPSPGPSPGSSGSTTTTTTSSTTVATTTPTTTPTETTTPTTQAPSETAKVKAVEVPVTAAETIREITNIVKPEDLGVAKIVESNLDVKQIGLAEVSSKANTSTIDTALAVATGEAKQVLTEVRSSVSSGGSVPLSVSKKVEVFEVKEKTTNKSSFVSKFTLSVAADKELKNVDIVEVIPKAVAADISDVKFLGEVPTVIQADPIVQWSFDTIKIGETKDLSYQVNKKVDELNTTTVAVSAAPVAEAPPAEKAELPAVVYILVAGIVVLVVLYFAYMKFYPRKKRK